MDTKVLFLLLVMAKLHDSHVIYTKEPSRYRVAYDEWKPVRDTPLRHVRYPIYHKNNGYSYIPGKKALHQTAEQSEKIEVFSPAPPTILGSFSVFGHATVNAREHASQMNKKYSRPHVHQDFATSESRTKVSSYQVRPQYPSAYSSYQHTDIKRPQYAHDYNEPSYFYEASLRPPPQDHLKTYSHSPLSPTSYYGYDQAQVYRDEEYTKPQKVHNTIRHHPTAYSTQLNDYKTTISPSIYDSTYSFYSSPNSEIDAEYYKENPIGAIPLNIKTDSHLKPVTENNIHDQLSHYGRPFQNSQSFTPVEETLKDNLDTFVTTFPSQSKVETKLKFSDVAQPFRVSSFGSASISSPKPESSHQVFKDEMLPISVTTIDVPVGEELYETKNNYDTYEQNHRTPFKPSPYDNSNHKITPTTHQSYENNQPVFLPTPSSNLSPYLIEPKSEITTINPVQNIDQDSNSISSLDNKVEEPSEGYTEVYSTIPIETTTKSRPFKSRRPTRPSYSSTATSYKYSDNDFKYERRRKPSNKVRSRDGLEKINLTKPTTTTTTTTTTMGTPANEETGAYQYTTILPDSFSTFEKYEYTGDKIVKTHTNEHPQDKNKNKNFNNDEKIENADELISTSSSTTVPTTVQTTQITTTPHNLIEPGTRLKSKYGNRPRFSIKDYREKLNRATSTTISPEESAKAKSNRNENEHKFRRTKTPGSIRSTTESSEYAKASNEPKFQKYKPRVGLSRYKTTSTTIASEIEGTAERNNTFRPSANRYNPGTGKYFSRYRTTTSAPKDFDDGPLTTTTKVTVRPKGVFSAKRQPFPLKSKSTTQKLEDNAKTEDILNNEDEPVSEDAETFPDTLKTNENEVFSAVITKKMDDSTTTTISSGEEEDTFEKEDEKETTGMESLRVADLTSSSSNEFKQTNYYKPEKVASKRPLSRITLPTDNPILPLEAFFQTQH